MVRCEYLNNRIYAALVLIGLVFSLLIWSAGGRVHFTLLAKWKKKR